MEQSAAVFLFANSKSPFPLDNLSILWGTTKSIESRRIAFIKNSIRQRGRILIMRRLVQSMKNLRRKSGIYQQRQGEDQAERADSKDIDIDFTWYRQRILHWVV